MTKLYVINAPCFVENHPCHTNGDVVTPLSDPMSEHFTYMYANLADYGLVDEVVIFPREGKHDKFIKEFPAQILTKKGKTISLNWNRKEKISIINEDPEDGYVYAYHNLKECKEIKNKFVIFNPKLNTLTHEDELDSRFHHYALIEGDYYKRTVTQGIPWSVCHLTSRAFTESDHNSFSTKEKMYDWIMISSFDPRKQHIPFLQSIIDSGLVRRTKGCIVGRDPNNKGKVTDHSRVYEQVREFCNYSDNVDLILNGSLSERIDLLNRSKIFVCVSMYDFGPRAVVEAAQLGLPVLSMPLVGSADLINENKNGSLIDRVEMSSTALEKMLINYESGNYTPENSAIERLLPEKEYPEIVEKIKWFKHEKSKH